jgi:NADPH:quinone reductase
MKRRIVCREFGPPESLVIEEFEPLTPGPGQVVVDVAACGVNFVDALIAAGRYQIKPKLPFTPGSEVAGVVGAVGDGVDPALIGTRVMSTGMSDGFTEQVCVRAASVVAVPDGVPLPIAATMTQNYCTMHYAFTRCDTIKAGDNVLVLGAGGGIGLAAVNIAAAMGATVIAAASSDAKLAAAVAVGATKTIDYATEDLKLRARELAGGQLDVVVDPVGGDYAEQALRALGWRGRFHVLGFANGAIPRVPINLVLLSNRTMIGVEWGAWTLRDPAGAREMHAEVLSAVASGRYSPPTPTEHRLEEAAAVLQAFLDRRTVGKVALVM